MFVFRAGPNALSIQPIHTWDLLFQNSKQICGLRLKVNNSSWLDELQNWKWTDPEPHLFLVHWRPTPFSLFCFLLLFCSWCLFISQRLCVNMSIWIKHIVCIYCLFTCIACKNNHSSFHVYSTTSASSTAGRDAKWAVFLCRVLGVECWRDLTSPCWVPEVRGNISSVCVHEEKFKKPWEKLYIKSIRSSFSVFRWNSVVLSCFHLMKLCDVTVVYLCKETPLLCLWSVELECIKTCTEYFG